VSSNTGGWGQVLGASPCPATIAVRREVDDALNFCGLFQSLEAAGTARNVIPERSRLPFG